MSKAFCIVTSVCVDTDERHSSVSYPMLESGSWDAKRAIYWSVATVLLCTSVRLNKNCRHVVYTNSRRGVVIRDVNIHRLLKWAGVECRHLPFRDFIPPESHCKEFRNAFYKLEVVCDLSKRAMGGALLLDSDCIALQPAERLIEKCQAGRLLLYDVYGREDMHSPVPHGISRVAMGNCFREILSEYPEPAPVWYGGEFVGGSQDCLKRLSEALKRDFSLARSQVTAKNICMANGSGFFDNDEFMSSFVYNQPEIVKSEVGGAFCRLNSFGSQCDPRSASADLIFAHLPGEKSTGLRHLFFEATNRQSDFWNIPPEELGNYVREFLGMPSRTRGLGTPPQIYSPTSRWILGYRRVLGKLRRALGLYN